jgi:hypothetical protein
MGYEASKTVRFAFSLQVSLCQKASNLETILWHVQLGGYKTILITILERLTSMLKICNAYIAFQSASSYEKTSLAPRDPFQKSPIASDKPVLPRSRSH